MRRRPAVAGLFYPENAETLKNQVRGFTESVAERIRAFGILSPHAGLIYSGGVAGAVYSRISMPETCVLIGPNHTGLGAPVSIMCEGSWETPLGTVPIKTSLARSIMSRSPLIKEDSLAHLNEHSLEVQLPFIQFLGKNISIVPIQMLDTRFATCLELGQAIAKSAAECETEKPENRNVLIVASSDMSHYEPAAAAKEKDFSAIRHILELDAEGLHRTIRKFGITMCGYGPAVVMLTACKILGATSAQLIKYSTSGDVNGDYNQVVGYAGIIVS